MGSPPLPQRESARSGPGVVVALCRAHSPVERELCEGWAQRSGTDRLVWSAGAALDTARPDDLVLPVGVLWRTREGEGLPRRIGEVAGELSARVRQRRQGRLAAHHPERFQVLTGQPATVQELQCRWTERSGRPASGPEFASFVERQADISLEREVRSIRGERYRAPRAAIDEVMTSPGFVAAIEGLAGRLERAPGGVMVDARAYLEEMVSEQTPLAVDLWARWARYLYSGGYRLDVDLEGLERIRELGATHPLVFLPSHRSNLDPYVMAALLYDKGMPQNHTLGGINMAFWPMGPIGRRVGVVFIRRSFRDNEVYRLVLQRYLAFLVGKRFNLEWYIEGTRSRTGKLLPPKLGLLNYLLDAIESLDRHDVYAVPTSIVYDVLPEARDMTAESRGKTKSQEGLGWLLRYARDQRGDMGSAHVRFGEPLNLADALRAADRDGSDPGATASEPSAPVTAGRTRSPSVDRLARSKVAFEICVRINRATVMTAPALLLFALLGVDDRALTLEQVHGVVLPLLEYADVRRIPVDRAARALQSEPGVGATLDFLIRHGIVECFPSGLEPVYRIRPDQQLVAAFYRNSVVHWFVARALVELLIVWAEAAPVSTDLMAAGRDQAMRMRDLLKHEFFFPEKREFEAELTAELKLVNPEWEREARERYRGVRQDLMQSGMLVAHRTLRCFAEAYSIVADRLVSLGSAPAEPDAIVSDCLDLGRQYRLQRRITSEEAVSAHLFRTALRLADQRHLLAGGAATVHARRAFQKEIDELLWGLQRIHDLDRSSTGNPRSARDGVIG